MNRHNKIYNFQCQKCSYSCVSKLALRRHDQNVHSGLKPHQCTLCGKSFLYTNMLEDHMNMHNNVKAYKCLRAGCGKGYSNRNSLFKHKQWHEEEDAGKNPPVDIEKLNCSLCGKSYWSQRSFKVHIKYHKLEQIQNLILEGKDVAALVKDFSFHCNLCPQVFLSKFEMRQHKKNHHYVKCWSCRKNFANDEAFKRHLVLGAKKTCEAQTNQGDVMQFACDSCPAGFQLSWKLHLHQRVLHSKGKHRSKDQESEDNSKIWSCISCDFKGNSKSSLRSHRVTEHPADVAASSRSFKGAKGYARTCEVEGCKKIFTTKKALRTHVQKAHSAKRKRKVESATVELPQPIDSTFLINIPFASDSETFQAEQTIVINELHSIESFVDMDNETYLIIG